LKLDEYKGPITRSKSKQLFILRSENHIPGISLDMAERNEQREKSIMRRDKEVEEMLQEIKKT
jgi:hypothetical protein